MDFNKFDTNKYLSNDQLRRCEEWFELSDTEEIMAGWVDRNLLYLEIMDFDSDETTIYEPDLSDEEGKEIFKYIMSGGKNPLDKVEEEENNEDMLVTHKEPLKEQSDPRSVTNSVYEAIEEGLLTWEMIGQAALKYMSEDEVADMMRLNFDWDYYDEDEDSYEDSMYDLDDLDFDMIDDEDSDDNMSESLVESTQLFAREIFDLTLQTNMLNADVRHDSVNNSISITESQENLLQLDSLIENLASQRGKAVEIEKTDFTHTYKLV